MATEPADADNLFIGDITDEDGIEAETKPSPEPSMFDGFGSDSGEDKERRPQIVKSRKSASDLITLAWGGIGTALVQTQADVPVGRVLQFQAPLAGSKLDALIAGSWLDALLQPLVRSSETLEGVGALVMFPLLIGAFERNPNAAPVLEPILRQVVRTTLVEMAPAIRKAQAQEKRAVQAMADLSDVLDIQMEKGQDPIDAVLEAIFAPPPEMEEPPPDE